MKQDEETKEADAPGVPGELTPPPLPRPRPPSGLTSARPGGAPAPRRLPIKAGAGSVAAVRRLRGCSTVLYTSSRRSWGLELQARDAGVLRGCEWRRDVTSLARGARSQTLLRTVPAVQLPAGATATTTHTWCRRLNGTVRRARDAQGGT